jgi:hypothetical protein
MLLRFEAVAFRGGLKGSPTRVQVLELGFLLRLLAGTSSL